jgi:undecaprenyl diphosphate synthase
MDTILDLCRKEKIRHVSLWALSDKNIRERSEEEVLYLFRLLETGIPRMVEKAIKNNTSLHIVGDLSLLPDSCRKACEEASEKTKFATEFSCTIAIGYGGQDEIVRAVKLCLAQ